VAAPYGFFHSLSHCLDCFLAAFTGHLRHNERVHAFFGAVTEGYLLMFFVHPQVTNQWYIEVNLKPKSTHFPLEEIKRLRSFDGPHLKAI
jgi:hypothetical protein